MPRSRKTGTRPARRRTRNEAEALCRLWALRMLLLPEARKGLAPFLLDAGILQRIGVKSASAQSHAEEEDLEIAHFTLAEVRRARNRCREPGFPEPLAGNLARFQSIFGLTRLEQNLIGFFVLLNKIEWFNECSQCLGHELGNLRICQILSHLLKAQTAEVKKALGSGGTLSRLSTGLLTVFGLYVAWTSLRLIGV